jgi:hypothetical protein
MAPSSSTPLPKYLFSIGARADEQHWRCPGWDCKRKNLSTFAARMPAFAGSGHGPTDGQAALQRAVARACRRRIRQSSIRIIDIEHSGGPPLFCVRCRNCHVSKPRSRPEPTRSGLAMPHGMAVKKVSAFLLSFVAGWTPIIAWVAWRMI